MKLKRRTYIIDTRLQMRFAFYFIVISLLGNIAALTVFNALSLRQLDTLVWSTHISAASTEQLITPIFMYVNVVNFFFVTIMLILAGILMVKKTSGPLYRMSKDIMQVSKGDLSSRIVLRHKDDFRDVALALNRMIEKTGERFADIKETYTGISVLVEILKHGTGNRQDAIRSYNSLLERIEEVEKKIDAFEV